MTIDAILISILTFFELIVATKPEFNEYLISWFDSIFLESFSSKVLLFLISIILLGMNLVFLFSGLTENKEKKAVTKLTNFGQVSISINTLENIALTATKKINGIKETKAYVTRRLDTISVLLKIVVLAELNIPTLAEDTQVRVKKTIEESTGIVVENVKVLVENIYGGYKSRVE